MGPWAVLTQGVDAAAGPGVVSGQAGSDDEGLGAPDVRQVHSPVLDGVAQHLGTGPEYQVEHWCGGQAAHHPGPGACGTGTGQHGGAGVARAAGGDRDHATGVLAVITAGTRPQPAHVLVLEPFDERSRGKMRAQAQVHQVQVPGQVTASGQQEPGLHGAEGDGGARRQGELRRLAGAGVQEAGQVHGDDRGPGAAEVFQEAAEVARHLGAPADAEDRVQHQVTAPQQSLQRVAGPGGELGEAVEGAAGFPKGIGAFGMAGLGREQGVGGDAVAAQDRGSVQAVPAVGTGPGEHQHPLSRWSVPDRAAAELLTHMTGQGVGGAQHQRLPHVQQRGLGRAHLIGAEAPDHASGSVCAVAPLTAGGGFVPRSATTIAVATEPSCEIDRCRCPTPRRSAARRVAPSSTR